MAYCSACGHLIPNEARFCRSCGAAQDVQMEPESQPNTTNQEKRKVIPPTTVATLFCSKCGNQILATAPFCRFCGQAQAQTVQTPTQYTAPTQYAPQPYPPQKGWMRRHPVWTVLLSFLLFVFSIPFWMDPKTAGDALYEADQASREVSRSDTHAEETPAPTITVSASKYYADYQANEVAADNLYKGKSLLITGVVQQITKDFTDHTVLYLNPELYTVEATLKDGQNSRAASVHIGQQVSLVCTGGTMMIDIPMLEDCQFQ